MKTIKLITFYVLGLISLNSLGADRYWVASGTSNWNNTANWSIESGGVGGASVPTATDVAKFDAIGLGNCNIDVIVTIDGFTIANNYTGIIDLKGFSFTTSGTVTLRGGTINDSSSTSVFTTNSTLTSTFSGTVFGATVNISSGKIFLNGSTFHGTASFTKTGSGNDFSVGGNTFNGTTTITNSGSNLIGLAATSPDIFNSPVHFNANTNRIYVSRKVGTTFGDNITLESMTSNGWILFGDQGGVSNLAEGKTVTISGGGFNGGQLRFRNFIQTGAMAQTITLSGGRLYLESGSSWNGQITATAPSIYLNGSTFHGTASFTKTGSGNDFSVGGNTFNGATTITNSGSNLIGLAATSPDTFNSTVHFNANTNRIYVSRKVGTTFGDNITLESMTSNGWILFGDQGGVSNLAEGKTVTTSGGGFNGGQLRFRNFVQTGATAQTITLNGGIIYLQQGTIWGGNLSVTAPNIYLEGSTFHGTASFTKTGGGNNFSIGGNTFNGNTFFYQNGNSNFVPANTTGNTFNANVTYQSSSGIIRPARAGTNSFKGDINVNFHRSTTFGSKGGKVVMEGTTAQSINDEGTSPVPKFLHLKIDNAMDEITLNTSITITDTLELVQGNINTTRANLLTMDDTSVVLSVSDVSYVNGPIVKIGNEPFTFPVGDGGHHQSIAISAPTNIRDAFMAEYFALNPDPTYDSASKDITIHHISQCEYWTLDRTIGSSNVNVSLGWDANSCGVTNISELIVIRWDGSQWQNHGNGSTTGNNTAGTITSLGALMSFGPFTLASTTVNNPLPIELVSFEAEIEDDKFVKLAWKTATEINNDYFSVEQSKEGNHWKVLKDIDGAGNSSKLLSYQFVDLNPYQGVSYYRLKQTDFDGQFSYSKIRSVNMENLESSEITLFPNFTKSLITIGGEAFELKDIKVYNVKGQEVTVFINMIFNNHSELVMDLSILNTGSYFIKTKNTVNKVYKE